MKFIDENELEHLLTYDKLIPQIKDAFSQEYNIPLRNHHQYPNPKETSESTILLMPAWDEGKYLGVKIVTLSPNNKNYGTVSIQGDFKCIPLWAWFPGNGKGFCESIQHSC